MSADRRQLLYTGDQYKPGPDFKQSKDPLAFPTMARTTLVGGTVLFIASTLLGNLSNVNAKNRQTTPGTTTAGQNFEPVQPQSPQAPELVLPQSRILYESPAPISVGFTNVDGQMEALDQNLGVFKVRTWENKSAGYYINYTSQKDGLVYAKIKLTALDKSGTPVGELVLEERDQFGTAQGRPLVDFFGAADKVRIELSARSYEKVPEGQIAYTKFVFGSN